MGDNLDDNAVNVKDNEVLFSLHLLWLTLEWGARVWVGMLGSWLGTLAGVTILQY